jgi:hypothetical protein
LTPKDAVAAVATSTAIEKIDVSVGERALLATIVLNTGALTKQPPADKFPIDWNKPEFIDLVQGKERTKPNFVIPGEAQVDLDTSKVWNNYVRLVNSLSVIEKCKDKDGMKGLASDITAYIAILNATGEKTPVSPLMTAIRMDAIVPGEYSVFTKAVKNGEAPEKLYILRVYVENSGGTSFAKSSIWYTLGFPGAATVSSGLVVSFRLVDPASASTLLTGIVRCAEKPRNMRSVARQSGGGSAASSIEGCAYISTPSAILAPTEDQQSGS